MVIKKVNFLALQLNETNEDLYVSEKEKVNMNKIMFIVTVKNDISKFLMREISRENLFGACRMEDEQITTQEEKNDVLKDCLYSMIFPYDREIEWGTDGYRGFPAFTKLKEFTDNMEWMQKIKDIGVVKIDNIDTFEDSTYYANGRRVHYGWIDWVNPSFDPSFLRTYCPFSRIPLPL